MHKVMIVDNEAAIRKGLLHCIRWEDLDCIIVAQAEDGIDALAQIPSLIPDIIISDIRMPEMDGLELARTLKQSYPSIKVIILTGFPDFDYAQQAISCQIVDFVLKPTTVDNLTSAIEKAKYLIAKDSAKHKLKKDLEDKEFQNLLLQRDMFFYDLLRGTPISQLYLLNRMAQLKLNLSEYFVIRMDIAPAADVDFNSSMEDDFLLTYLKQAQTILKDCIGSCPIHFISNGDQSCYVIAETNAPILLSDACMETVSILSGFSTCFLYMGISTRQKEPFTMAKAASEACQAAQFARYTPEGSAVSFHSLPSVPREVMQRVHSDLRLLQSAIENRNPEGSFHILKKLFLFIRENKLPMETAKDICLSIHPFCMQPSLVLNSDEPKSADAIASPRQLMEQGSLLELETYMQDFVDHLFTGNNGSFQSEDEFIQKVKLYIANHYDENLSLENLAEKVHLSPSYLSRLFKKETSENLSNYVQNLRIEEAKILLQTTKLKAYEVGERVGIPDPVYFSKLFKKVTGKKPKDYRMSLLVSRLD